jgi:hypothetical protein
MEEVLKGLKGKNLTKKKLFDFLADINLEEILGKSQKQIEPIKIELPPEEHRCGGCDKTFATKSSLKRHLIRYQVCRDWIELPQKTETNLTTGIHHIVDNLLEKSIGENGNFECKFCKTKFITKGNHHKHFNTASVCNRLAFLEFKKMLNSL